VVRKHNNLGFEVKTSLTCSDPGYMKLIIRFKRARFGKNTTPAYLVYESILRFNKTYNTYKFNIWTRFKMINYNNGLFT